jgi:hypothetical protein
MGKMCRDVQECVVTCWERLVFSPERRTRLSHKGLQPVKLISVNLNILVPGYISFRSMASMGTVGPAVDTADVLVFEH